MIMSKAKMTIQGTENIGSDDLDIDCDEVFKSNFCIKLDNGMNMRVKAGYPDTSEVFKIFGGDVLAYTHSNKKTCRELTKDEQLCKEKWCWCNYANLPYNYKEKLSTLDKSPAYNIGGKDVSIFWPQGYSFDGSSEDNVKKSDQCFLMYQQAILNGGKATSIKKYPAIALVTDGC